MTKLLWPLYPMMLAASFLTGLAPARLGLAVSELVGALAYWVLPARRRVMGHNYAPVLGQPANHPRVRQVGRLSMRNYARYVYEVMRYPHVSVDEIDRRVSLHVGEDFHEARLLNKGMVFVSAHFGNMDYTGVAVSKHIVPMTVIADPIRPKQLMDRLVQMRGQKGVKIVYMQNAARAAMEALKRNEAVGFLVDVGYARKGGIPVTFFGKQTAFPSGPVSMALRTGAPIVVGYARVIGRRIEAHSYPPIFAVPSGNRTEDLRRYSQMIAAYFEDFIGRFPEQWYIYRPMWNVEATPPRTETSSWQEVLPEGARPA